MARKQSGGFNRFLNFIGLVDDDSSRDTYGEEYQNGNYGRPAAYTPARRQRTETRQPQQRRPRIESETGRYNTRDTRYGSRNGSAPEGYSYAGSRSMTRRPSSRFADDSDFNGYMPRTERLSRFEEAPQNPQPARMRVSRRSRTVMYSLHSLEDCCEVIDQLIANNTVVLTMDELDGRLMQRAVDTLSGAVFALHASIRKASDRTYLVAPKSVEVDDAFDVEHGFR